MSLAAVALGVWMIADSREYATHSFGTGMSLKGWRGMGTAVVHADTTSADTIRRVLTRRIVSSPHGPRPSPALRVVARAPRDPGSRPGARGRPRPRARRRRRACHGRALGHADRLRAGTRAAPPRPVRPARHPDR